MMGWDGLMNRWSFFRTSLFANKNLFEESWILKVWYSFEFRQFRRKWMIPHQHIFVLYRKVVRLFHWFFFLLLPSLNPALKGVRSWHSARTLSSSITTVLVRSPSARDLFREVLFSPEPPAVSTTPTVCDCQWKRSHSASFFTLIRNPIPRIHSHPPW